MSSVTFKPASIIELAKFELIPTEYAKAHLRKAYVANGGPELGRTLLDNGLEIIDISSTVGKPKLEDGVVLKKAASCPENSYDYYIFNGNLMGCGTGTPSAGQIGRGERTDTDLILRINVTD